MACAVLYNIVHLHDGFGTRWDMLWADADEDVGEFAGKARACTQAPAPGPAPVRCLYLGLRQKHTHTPAPPSSSPHTHTHAHTLPACRVPACVPACLRACRANLR